MKKKIFGFVLAFCLILPCSFMMTACNDGITDCAYIQFVPAVDGEVVQYTSYMYADDGEKAHIYLFESEAMRDSGWGDNYILKISFNRGLGVDFNIDDKQTLVVDIEGWYKMDIAIKKEYYYNADDTAKKVYLNGVDITSNADSVLSSAPRESTSGTFWFDGYYSFEDFGLVKGNTSNYINTIEFK